MLRDQIRAKFVERTPYQKQTTFTEILPCPWRTTLKLFNLVCCRLLNIQKANFDCQFTTKYVSLNFNIKQIFQSMLVM